jgi:NAD(P)-dependent dehydrogenase (short-subunit alcohol dehydrogenase family)
MSISHQSTRFQGTTVIVTGAGSGIGRATAHRLAHEQARVIATDVSEPWLIDLASALSTADLVTVAGDIADPETVSAVVSAAGERIDGLANVAGIMDGFLPPAEIDDATWERVMSVNLTGPMRLVREVLPVMLQAGRGAIVNVGSEASLRASASGVAYTVSKHALVGLTKSIAFFYGPQGIRANLVAPGAVATNIEAPMRSDLAAARLAPFMQTNIPGVAQAEQLAAAITWLLSDDSSNVSGAVLPSDGGWSTV